MIDAMHDPGTVDADDAAEATDPVDELHRVLTGMDDRTRAADLARGLLDTIRAADWHWSDAFDTREQYEAFVREGEEDVEAGRVEPLGTIQEEWDRHRERLGLE